MSLGLVRLGVFLSGVVLLWPEMAVPETGIDPVFKYAWGENVGWLNACSAEHTVTIHYSEASGGWLTGYVWSENIGWIVMGSAAGGPYANTSAENWGVNLAADGKLTGYAWGENVGWINFEQTYGQPAISLDNGEFSGHAWGENIGWILFPGLAPDHGVRTLAFDKQPKGTPNWWLANHAVTEDYDAGDGVPASEKYVMDVDPTVAGNYLRIISITEAEDETELIFTPSSIWRYYTLIWTDGLTDTAEWDEVAGQIRIAGAGGEQVLRDPEPGSRGFYRIRVEVNP